LNSSRAKFTQADYDGMRLGLEAEAARIMAEIEMLESAAAASEQTSRIRVIETCFHEWTPSGSCRLQHFDFGHDAGSLCFQAQTHAVIVA